MTIIEISPNGAKVSGQVREWAVRGACRDHPELDWFVEGMDTAAVRERNECRKICNTECPVRSECLEWALVYEQHGVWGGETARARKQMRNRLNIRLINLGSGLWDVRRDFDTNPSPSLPVNMFASTSYRHITLRGEAV